MRAWSCGRAGGWAGRADVLAGPGRDKLPGLSCAQHLLRLAAPPARRLGRRELASCCEPPRPAAGTPAPANGRMRRAHARRACTPLGGTWVACSLQRSPGWSAVRRSAAAAGATCPGNHSRSWTSHTRPAAGGGRMRGRAEQARGAGGCGVQRGMAAGPAPRRAAWRAQALAVLWPRCRPNGALHRCCCLLLRAPTSLQPARGWPLPASHIPTPTISHQCTARRTPHAHTRHAHHTHMPTLRPPPACTSTLPAPPTTHLHFDRVRRMHYPLNYHLPHRRLVLFGQRRGRLVCSRDGNNNSQGRPPPVAVCTTTHACMRTGRVEPLAPSPWPACARKLQLRLRLRAQPGLRAAGDAEYPGRRQARPLQAIQGGRARRSQGRAASRPLSSRQPAGRRRPPAPPSLAWAGSGQEADRRTLPLPVALGGVLEGDGRHLGSATQDCTHAASAAGWRSGHARPDCQSPMVWHYPAARAAVAAVTASKGGAGRRRPRAGSTVQRMECAVQCSAASGSQQKRLPASHLADGWVN